MAKANVSNTLVVPAASKVFPYHDDFNEDKNFHRVLFRPGYGVQARELTQLQTILQNQIERFGNHVFKNGSSVLGGEVWLQDNYSSAINLSSSYANTDIDIRQFEKKILVLPDDDNTIQFRVRAIAEENETTPPVVFGDYLTVDHFKNGQTIKVLDEEVYANAASANCESACRFAHLRDSIFYFNGYFIKSPEQSTPFAKFNDFRPNVKIGMEFDDEIITENSDSSLLDPALEAFNFQAPGAARYKINLNLSTRSIDTEDSEKFVELAKVENGILRRLTKFPVYAELEEVLARRTYDESGNYTVAPFSINFNQSSINSPNTVTAVLSPGKAYVYGYEFETISDTTLTIPRARTTNLVADQDLNMNYGNYVITSNLRGDFGITTMDLFDIHCVPHGFINYSSNAAYQTTKTGTGRIKTLEFYSGDADVNARRYEFYLFDTRYRAISSNLASITNRTVTLFNGTNLLSANTNAYNNARLRITSGPGTGFSYNISAYNSSTRSLTIDRDFFVIPNATSNASIEFDFNDSQSFVKHTPYTHGATANAYTNVTPLNKQGGTGPTFISESSLDTLVFKLPEDWIASGITEQVYTYTRKYSSVQFLNGVSSTITSGLNEDFVGTSSTSNTSSTVMNNFLVVVDNPQSSGRQAGDVVKVTTSVTGSTPEQAVFNTAGGSGDTFTATVYTKNEFKPGVQSKLKLFVPANTRTFSSATAAGPFTNATGSTTRVYLSAGQIYIQNPSKKVGIPESMFISDVIAISKIYDLNGQPMPAPGADLTVYNDVTDRYEFDNGQRDNFYDHASIRLKPDYAPCNGPLIVCCRYYNHTSVSGEGGYFSVDSYPDLSQAVIEEGTLLGDGYSLIPDYVASSGARIPLRDSIDFRPKRVNAVSTAPNYTLSDIKIPTPTTDFELTYRYFMGRRDLIVLNSNRTITLVPGTPAKFPQNPSVPGKSMVLYSLFVEPYTKFPSNVFPKYVENKRYTMRDIGKIDKRVQNLEYYVTLNTLEKDALDISIRDVNGLERTKYGVFVDTFKGHALGASTRDDYKCSMNFKEGWLQCQANTDGFTLVANTALSSNVVFTRDKVLLPYTQVRYISQPLASKFAPVAEYLFGAFYGTIFTLPEADIWKSTNTAPDIVISDTDTNEYTNVNIYQTVVNSQSR
jgi:hypothetical protein